MNEGALTPGSKLGPYEILSQLGAGGMGEVYVAKDTRLDRQVAIKVLPSHVANNPDLRLRFEREARAISSLNHPNICSLYDVGNQDGVEYLVMEYLQGETLAARLERGPIPVDEILTYAVQIADALDKAHRQNLIHRDLKTLNIMLTKNGAKLLDFGLAKIQMGSGVITGMTGLTHTTPLTGEGAIVGTLQYMSPEQVEGKEADTRSDLFSFGVVLYEMVTGKRPFSGKSQASLMASILREDPRSVTEFQPETPPALVRVIKQCLSKDPDERWQSARDLLHQLKWINEGGSLAGIAAPIAAKRKKTMQLAWIVSAVLGVSTVTLGVLYFGQKKEIPQVNRFTISGGPTIRNMRWPMISPDGRMIAFNATDTGGKQMIWIRSLESLDAVPLTGTENPGRPFWSPDSKQIAYFADGKLRRVAAAGGPVQLIAAAANSADGAWGRNDVILFDGRRGDAIRQIAANGGTISDAVPVKGDSLANFGWPCFLPDGEHFIYLDIRNDSDTSSLGSRVMLGSLKAGEMAEPLFNSSSRPLYDPAGYILSVEGNILTARKFNFPGDKKVGEPFPLAEVSATSTNRQADFSLSENGTLIYQPEFSRTASDLVWVDRAGRVLDTVASNQRFWDMDISPDGKRLAYSQGSEEGFGTDVWTLDLERKVSTQATFAPGSEEWPIWSPDGSEVYYTSSDKGWKLVRKKMSRDGDGEIFPTAGKDTSVAAIDWSPRGDCLSLLYQVSGNNTDLVLYYPGPPSRFETFASTPFFEFQAIFSPDGRAIAYQSVESGEIQLYVRELEGNGEKIQLTTEGAESPVWSSDGRELFYYSLQGKLKSIAISTSPSLKIGATTTLFDFPLELGGRAMTRRFIVSSDGQRFLMNRRNSTTSVQSFVLVQNWTSLLMKD